MEKIPEKFNEDFEKLDIVKRYFSRIFTILSKDIRQNFMKLNLSENVKKLIIQELAFLSEEKQKEYLEELTKLYNRFLK